MSQLKIVNPQILIRREQVVVPANSQKVIELPSMRQFILMSNSSTEDIYIAIGNSSDFQPWPVLYSYATPNPGELFDKVAFKNTSAVAMTINYFASNGIIDNKTAWILGQVITDNTSDDIETPAAVTVIEANYSVLIDASPAIDAGGGLVTIPVTGHPFIVGNMVTITDCPQYNGTYEVQAIAANSIDITATFKGGVIDNAAAVDAGGGVVSIPITGHNYTAGETITIAGTVNYDGDYTVEATSGVNTVDITVAYAAEVFTGAETHTLTFDNADDTISLSTPNVIPADGDRKELHITNHDAANAVYFGDANIDPDNNRGVIIQPNSVYILTCTDAIFLACKTGETAICSWANFTKS